MARPISDEELQLKKRARRRLIGAIVLVTAVAVILPMVLDSEPRPVSQSVNIQIPSPDSGDYKPKGAASTPIRTDKATKAPPEAVASKLDPGPIATITEPPAAKPPAAKETAKAVEPKADKARDAKGAAKDGVAQAGGYVVQIEALADASKAKHLEKQAIGAGFKVYTEVVTTQAGELTRVRVGPYPNPEAAEKARTQLKKAGMNGKVMRLDGKVVPKSP